MIKNTNKTKISRILLGITFPALMVIMMFMPSLEAAEEGESTPVAIPQTETPVAELSPVFLPIPVPTEIPVTDTTPWLCEGFMGETIPQDNEYYITSFGCYVDANGVSHGDSGDNCVPGGLQYAKDAGVCESWMSGRQCEESVVYFTAGASRYSYLTKLKITNPENGRSIVAIVLDGGPACWVENNAQKPVIDVSRPVSFYLFGGGRGYSDQDIVIAEAVDYSTPLGPVDANNPPSIVAFVPEPEPEPTNPLPGQEVYEMAQRTANTGNYEYAYNSNFSGSVEFKDAVPFVMTPDVKYAVNGRSQPNAQSELVSVLYRENGWEVTYITEVVNGWGKVETGGTVTMWVWMEFFERPPTIPYAEYVQSIG